MAAAAPPPVLDQALPTLHDSPSHTDLQPESQGSQPVPFPRQSNADARAGGAPGSGSKQTIESHSASGSGALSSPPRSAASPAASIGHTVEGSHSGPGIAFLAHQSSRDTQPRWFPFVQFPCLLVTLYPRVLPNTNPLHSPAPLADPRYLNPNPILPPPVSHPRRIKDDDLPPLPTPDSEASSSTPGLFRRITKRLRPAVGPGEQSDAPTSFQISLPTRSRSRSRSRARGDSASGADAPQPQIGKQRRPHVRIPVPIPKAPAPAPLPNSFTSAENRRAALRARGLVPASGSAPRYRDAHGYWMPLSEQERELDRMFAVVVEEKMPSPDHEDTEAKKFRDAWLAKYRSESEQGNGSEDQATTAASPSSDARHGVRAVYEDGSRSALPSATDLAHASEPSRHARRPSADGAMRGRAYSASATAENRRPDLMPVVDPSLPEMPFEDTAAHRLPRARDRRSSDVSERVSRWFQTSLRPRSASASRPASAGADGGARFGLFSRRRSTDALVVATPYTKESDARRSADVTGWDRKARTSADSEVPGTHSLGRRHPARKLPPAPPSAFTPVKEKRDATATATAAATATASPTDVSPAAAAAPAISISQPNTSRTSLERADDSQSPRVRRVQVNHRRGRSTTVSDLQQHSAAPGAGTLESSSSLVSRSHSHTMPALSPTRSTSSSEMGLPATPTTDTHGCEPPPPPPREHHPNSGSGRSQSQPIHHQPVKQPSQNSLSRAKTMAKNANAPSVPQSQRLAAAHASGARDDTSTESDLDSSYVDVEVDVEFGVRMQSEAQKMRDLMAAAATASARPRPRRESVDDPERRRSLTIGLFAKKEDGDAPPRFKNPRAMSSMQNMKRTVTGTLASLKPRPKTIVEDNTHGEPPRSPPSPPLPPLKSAPPTSFPQVLAAPKRRKNSVTQEQGSSGGPGSGPRQALSPTMYKRGSLQVEAGRIEDEESRRLSEMAFLDY
ncbi:uncharacterized protein C8Q71DRAFT_726765 [Rhodofomes roseus]|uniref:Uncharacterized protein n=1 Tax=Rhodofomes roseus TaxID=34475 RepID=A0ABQ8K3Z7_9APHY|nr:uncharacterized protein C8Q71DRAFT_726765 [Rhodofomes roseus]KAH9831580.1 hypothetical protein C8Q71DRAFT_726765 [Rhodofomes roseus]